MVFGSCKMVLWYLDCNFGAKEETVISRTECPSVLTAVKELKHQCFKTFTSESNCFRAFVPQRISVASHHFPHV